MPDHTLWVRLLGENAIELFRERKRDNRKRGMCLHVLDHNNLPSKRELLSQVQPLGGTGDCSFPECAWGCLQETFGPGREESEARGEPRVQQGAGDRGVRDNARPWQWHTKRLCRYPDRLHAVVCKLLSTALRASLKERIGLSGTQWEPLSYPHSHKYCKKKSC